MASEVNAGIELSLQWLKSSSDGSFEQQLSVLSNLVELSSSLKVQSLESIRPALAYCPSNNVQQLRIYRGILLVIRNLAPSLNPDYFPLVI